MNSPPPTARTPPGVFALPFGIVVLLTGLWGGLARLGYTLPAAHTSAAQHGVLMSLGFLGTLISIERAVALARWWAWLVPGLSALGSIGMVLGGAPQVGYALLTAAGALLVGVYARLDRIQRSTHNTLMGLAAAGWAVGTGLATAGRPISDVVPWLAVFLVVTITAERLELSRMLRRTTPVRVALVVAIGAMVAGATLSAWQPDAGMRVTGIAMVAMAVWLGIYDLARRTIRAAGVTRFMAAGLLAGYVWLAGGGTLWAVGGRSLSTAVYDAELHTIFLGFVMSMVFAHAPVIAPAVVRRPLPYFPLFYAPLALLHVSLVLRVLVGDAAAVTAAWRWGGVLGEVAILGFVAVTVGAFVRAAVTARSRDAARTTAPSVEAAPSNATSRLTPPRPRAARFGLAGIGVVVIAGIIVTATVLTHRTPAAPAATSVISAAEAAAGVPVSLVEMRIEPSVITVAPGTHLVLTVTNNGTMRHDLALSTGQATPLLDPGETATLDAGIISAAAQGWCTVPGHRQAGMTMSIAVTGAHGGHGMAPAQTSPDASSADLAGTPPEGWTPIDAALPPAPDTTVHAVTWHIRDVETSVAPDVTQLMWTFDGRVPGPVLRGTVGDRFDVTVVNDTDMTHNIDFHAESGPPASTMTPIPPGATHTYSFVATHAGAWLYHCSMEPMLLHMGNGMYGALIVDPPDLAPAAAEYLLVGSELFFGPPGQVGDSAKMAADQPDAVVFNGYPFAYQKQPLKAKTGELVRIWVVNAGPSRAIAFHVVGAPFVTEYLGGAYLLRDGQSGAGQILPVAAGDGGFVELRFAEPGNYPFLTHVMADAALGAAGAFDVSH